MFLKYYIPGNLKLFWNFHEKTPPVLLKTVDLCLKMSSDFNYNFCYVRLPVERNRENTNFVNSTILSFQTLDWFLSDYLSQGLNSSEHNPKIGHSTYLWNMHTIALWLQMPSSSSHKKRRSVSGHVIQVTAAAYHSFPNIDYFCPFPPFRWDVSPS